MSEIKQRLNAIQNLKIEKTDDLQPKKNQNAENNDRREESKIRLINLSERIASIREKVNQIKSNNG